jgi:hypothetical protein
MDTYNELHPIKVKAIQNIGQFLELIPYISQSELNRAMIEAQSYWKNGYKVHISARWQGDKVSSLVVHNILSPERFVIHMKRAYWTVEDWMDSASNTI